MTPGTQWCSWIHITDAVQLIISVLDNEQIRGPVNLTSPNPVRNREFAEVFAQATTRSLRPPIPGRALHLMFGKWQLIVYGGAMHGFTRDIGPALPGVAYNSVADSRSFAAIKAFLKEIFEGSSTSEQPVRWLPADTARRPGTAGGPEVGVTCGCLPSPPDQRLFPPRTTSATPNATASHT